eukprot:1159102-Pelagomonas_calceolata.AAC.7
MLRILQGSSLKDAIEVAVLLPGGPQLILGPGAFAVSDLHKMDMPQFCRTALEGAQKGYRRWDTAAASAENLK